MKICCKCRVEKNINYFWKHKSSSDWLQGYCKECYKIIMKEYVKTKKWLITKIYGAQISNSKIRGHVLPSYTKEELKKWIFEQLNFETLYNNWVNSWCLKDLVPSVDRLNDNISYTLDNIRLITWIENKQKHYRDRKNWINNKASKAVLQYTKTWIFIKEYYSIRKAWRCMNINSWSIHICCTWKSSTAWWFKWKFKF